MTVFFMLLGSARVKAAHKMLMKLTPGHGILNHKLRSVSERKVIKKSEEFDVKTWSRVCGSDHEIL